MENTTVASQDYVTTVDVAGLITHQGMAVHTARRAHTRRRAQLATIALKVLTILITLGAAATVTLLEGTPPGVDTLCQNGVLVELTRGMAGPTAELVPWAPTLSAPPAAIALWDAISPTPRSGGATTAPQASTNPMPGRTSATLAQPGT